MFKQKYNYPKYHLRSEGGLFKRMFSFKRKKQGIVRNFKFPFARIFNVILISAVLYFGYHFLFSSKFTVENIVIRGLNFIPPEELLNFVDQDLDEQKFLFFKTRNIFLISKTKLLNNIAEHYLFDSIDLNKILPNSLDFEIIEKNIVYRIRSAQSEYLVDDHGLVVKNFMNFTQRPSLLQLTAGTSSANDVAGDSESEKPDAPSIDTLVSIDPTDHFTLLYLENDADVKLGQKVLNDQQVAFVDQIISTPKGKYFDLKLVILPNSNPEYLSLVTKDGWRIFFNIRNDLNQQIQALNMVIEQKIGKENLKRLDNIDLRLGSSVFYKMK